MIRALAALLLLTACNSADNMIVGGVAAGATTPDIIFDTIGSSIHGVATMRDASGNPVGAPLAVVLMSNVGNLCGKLQSKPDYFRNPPEAYEALIMTVPQGFLGTFVIGRLHDAGTSAEIVAVSGPQAPTPLHALNTSYIAVTNFPGAGSNATGSFNLITDDPSDSTVSHQFYGRFKTSFCPTLEGTLLP